jgi:hypothetical protein
MAIILEIKNKEFKDGCYYFSISYISIIGIIRRDRECFFSCSKNGLPSLMNSKRTLPRSMHKFIYKFLSSPAGYYIRN